MSDIKLLIVEDNDADLETCRDCVNDFNNENDCQIKLVECRNLDEALKNLDKTFDGAIIDIRLEANGSGDEGIIILNKMEELYSRIPVAVLTGTPGSVEKKPNYIGVFTKGQKDSGYNDLLKLFLDIYNTGLTRIMGGRGRFEDELSRIFNDLFMQEEYKKKWIEYGRINTLRTEKALLRHSLSYMLHLLEDYDDIYFPEEVYLMPPLITGIRTGSVVLNKESDQNYIVMTPACDLVIRKDGKIKTDRILIAEIDSSEFIFKKYTKTDDKEKAHKNTLTPYYHWLPETSLFKGGFINFRKLTTIESEKFNAIFDEQIVLISPPFVKDIVSRFSSYYARQGQPEIDKSLIFGS